MKTGTLFDRPLARPFDPQTSHDAAKRITKSGTAARHRQIIVDTLRAAGCALTGTEIAARCGLTQHQVMRRVNELRPDSLRRIPVEGKHEDLHELKGELHGNG